MNSTSNTDKSLHQTLKDTEQHGKQEDLPSIQRKVPSAHLSLNIKKTNTLRKEVKPFMEKRVMELKRLILTEPTKRLRQKPSQNEENIENMQSNTIQIYILPTLNQIQAVYKGKRHRDKILLRRRYQTKRGGELNFMYKL